jgi:hypothetical protein
VSASLAVPWFLWGWAWRARSLSAHLTPEEFRSWHGVGMSSKRSAQDRLAYFSLLDYYHVLESCVHKFSVPIRGPLLFIRVRYYTNTTTMTYGCVIRE